MTRAGSSIPGSSRYLPTEEGARVRDRAGAAFLRGAARTASNLSTSVARLTSPAYRTPTPRRGRPRLLPSPSTTNCPCSNRAGDTRPSPRILDPQLSLRSARLAGAHLFYLAVVVTISARPPRCCRVRPPRNRSCSTGAQEVSAVVTDATYRLIVWNPLGARACWETSTHGPTWLADTSLKQNSDTPPRDEFRSTSLVSAARADRRYPGTSRWRPPAWPSFLVTCPVRHHLGHRPGTTPPATGVRPTHPEHSASLSVNCDILAIPEDDQQVRVHHPPTPALHPPAPPPSHNP